MAIKAVEKRLGAGMVAPSFELVGAYPADQERLDQETLCHLRGVVARLGGAAVLEQSLKGLTLLGCVSVPHVLAQPMDESESVERFDAWRRSDFVQSVAKCGQLLRSLSFDDFSQILSSKGSL